MSSRKQDPTSVRFIKLVDEMIERTGKKRGGQALASRVLGVSTSFIPQHRAGDLTIGSSMAEHLESRTGIDARYFLGSGSDDWRTWYDSPRIDDDFTKFFGFRAAIAQLQLLSFPKSFSTREAEIRNAIALLGAWDDLKTTAPLVLARAARDSRDDDALVRWAAMLRVTTREVTELIQSAYDTPHQLQLVTRAYFEVLMDEERTGDLPEMKGLSTPLDAFQKQV